MGCKILNGKWEIATYCGLFPTTEIIASPSYGAVIIKRQRSKLKTMESTSK